MELFKRYFILIIPNPPQNSSTSLPSAPGQQGHYWNPLFNENGIDVKEKGYATNLSTDFALT